MMDIDSEIGSLLHMSSGTLSDFDCHRLADLKAKKDCFLSQDILTLKLKSIALWICEGDVNTKFFHSYASTRRNFHAIQALSDHEGHLVSIDTPLKQLGEQHIFELFKDYGKTNIGDQLKVISLFPSYVQEYEKDCFLAPITLSEVESALKGFKKDKIPSHDSWPIEFFLSIF